jgi:ferredoxin--NADP+ reductase
MNRIVERRMLVPNIHLLTVEAPQVSRKARPGNFIIVMPDERGERIPLTLADWDADRRTVTCVFMVVGASTADLARMGPGDSLYSLVGPLGTSTEVKKFGTVVCAGGCYGIGSIYPVARAMAEAGNRVISLIEARSSYLLYWGDRFREVSRQLVEVTTDGSSGTPGHNSDVLTELLQGKQKIDRVIAYGCTFMMKLAADATRKAGVKTIVSLNPIMVDGTGMCGVCRCEVAGKSKFACVDGPEFDAHEVNWDNLALRRTTYVAEERHAVEKG